MKVVVKFFLIIAAGTLLFNGCAPKPITSLSKELRDLRPGVLEGYLPANELPNSLVLLPPPPQEGSTAFQLDQEIAAGYVASGDEVRSFRRNNSIVVSDPAQNPGR